MFPNFAQCSFYLFLLFFVSFDFAHCIPVILSLTDKKWTSSCQVSEIQCSHVPTCTCTCTVMCSMHVSPRRPPGHHAECEFSMGFCHFNNVAVAAQYAVDKLGLER